MLHSWQPAQPLIPIVCEKNCTVRLLHHTLAWWESDLAPIHKTALVDLLKSQVIPRALSASNAAQLAAGSDLDYHVVEEQEQKLNCTLAWWESELAPSHKTALVGLLKSQVPP